MSEAKKAMFDVIFEARGVAVGKLRNEVTIEAREPFTSVNMLATDEGPFQGGEGTAPTPLEYFLTGLVGCLMTQIRVFSKRMKVPIDDLQVDCRAHWSAHPDEVGLYQGFPESFEIDVKLTSSEPESLVEEMVSAARRGCFVERTMAQANVVTHKLEISKIRND